MLTPMMIQYLVGLCCLRHDPDAVEITLGDMVYDHVAEKDRDVDITITFKEGINMRAIATLISENTNNSYDSILKVASDEEFINTLIDKYWFLTDDIKNKNIISI